jgi:hypothetical protein
MRPASELTGLTRDELLSEAIEREAMIRGLGIQSRSHMKLITQLYEKLQVADRQNNLLKTSLASVLREFYDTAMAYGKNDIMEESLNLLASLSSREPRAK